MCFIIFELPMCFNIFHNKALQKKDEHTKHNTRNEKNILKPLFQEFKYSELKNTSIL